MATNKTGADKILSVYWFAILFIVASGIFAMVYVFYNSPFDVRNAEADALGNQIASCILQNGKISSSWTTAKTSATSSTCQTPAECQKITGEKIVSIVNGMKGDLVPDIDSLVKREGVAENFECLVLQIAAQESSLKHCKESQKNGDAFYCDGIRSEVNALDNERETSLGVMQVNTKVHNVQAEFFDKGVAYAVKDILTKGYDSSDKDYACNGKNYGGWERALRNYNGWNTACTDSSGKLIGNPNYVEEVIGKKSFIQQTFPEFCSSGKIVDVSKQKNLGEECHLNFNSESKEEQYYIEIDFYDLKTLAFSESNGKKTISSQPIATIYDGNINLKADCEVQETKDYQKQSKCFEKIFYAIDEKNNQHAIKITSVVRKTEQNAKK